MAEPSDLLKVSEHDREGFGGAAFDLSESSDAVRIQWVGHEIIASHTFECDNSAAFQDLCRSV